MLERVKTPLEHRFVRAGGHTLHTVVLGDPAKPPLVMLHGHGGGLGVFAGTFDALATGLPCLRARFARVGGARAALPSGGKSPAEAQAWWVASLEAWRRAVGLRRFYPPRSTRWAALWRRATRFPTLSTSPTSSSCPPPVSRARWPCANGVPLQPAAAARGPPRRTPGPRLGSRADPRRRGHRPLSQKRADRLLLPALRRAGLGRVRVCVCGAYRPEKLGRGRCWVSSTGCACPRRFFGARTTRSCRRKMVSKRTRASRRANSCSCRAWATRPTAKRRRRLWGRC